MLVRDDVAAPPRGDDRDMEQLGEPGEVARGPRAEHATAGEDHGAIGRGQELEDRPDVTDVGPRQRRARDVDRQCLAGASSSRRSSGNERSTGPGRPPIARRIASPTATAASPAVHGSAAQVANLAERLDLVDLLERLAAAVGAQHLADEREHRGRVLAGRVDPDGEVGGTDRPRRKARRRAAGELAVGLRHERGGAFVAGRNEADPGLLQSVEEAEEALAGNGEGVPDAGCAEGLGDDPADRSRAGGGLRGGLGRRRPPPAQAGSESGARSGSGSGCPARAAGLRLGLGRRARVRLRLGLGSAARAHASGSRSGSAGWLAASTSAAASTCASVVVRPAIHRWHRSRASRARLGVSGVFGVGSGVRMASVIASRST